MQKRNILQCKGSRLVNWMHATKQPSTENVMYRYFTSLTPLDTAVMVILNKLGRQNLRVISRIKIDRQIPKELLK